MFTRHQKLTWVLLIVLVFFSLSVCMQYQAVSADLRAARATLETVQSDLQAKSQSLDQTQATLRNTQTALTDTQANLDKTSATLKQTQADYAKAQATLATTLQQVTSLTKESQRIATELDNIEKKYSYAKTVPYVTISGRQVDWVWRTSTGAIKEWYLPLDTYRSYIKSYYPTQQLTITNSRTGTRNTITGFRPYVKPAVFTDVAPKFYREVGGDKAYLHEIWYLVTQLTTYTADIGEQPRWGVETLTEAGGDCEDFAILIATLLKAASPNYKLSLVYMDADHPTAPVNVNHCILYVEYGSTSEFIDGTCKSESDPWGFVQGWYYEIP
jgi:hypothetical protein